MTVTVAKMNDKIVQVVSVRDRVWPLAETAAGSVLPQMWTKQIVPNTTFDGCLPVLVLSGFGLFHFKEHR